MAIWTPEAEKELSDRISPSQLFPFWLAEFSRLVGDLVRKRAEETAQASGREIISPDDVREGLRAITGQAASANQPHPSARHTVTRLSREEWMQRLWLLIGFFIPASLIAIETGARLCRENLFDPFPTPLHYLLALSVPAAALTGHLALLGRIDARRWRWNLLAGIAIGASAFFALLLAPFAPRALLWSLLVVGLFPLAVIFALPALVQTRRAMGRQVHWTKRDNRLCYGLAVSSFLVLLLLHVPVMLTALGGEWAMSGSPERQKLGLKLFKVPGTRWQLLDRYCRPWGAVATIYPYSLGARCFGDDAERVYFRVTGQEARSGLSQASFWLRRLYPSEWMELNIEDLTPSQANAAHPNDLWLVSSQMTSEVDPAAALVYTEWTMEIQNDGDSDQEASATVLLPREGVVSRAVLWINGDPHEAAFAGATVVREAYEETVQKRRDPLLVTSAGADRVSLECFPAPRRGGRVTVLLGMTAPLRLDRLDEGSFRLPSVVRSNFEREAGRVHSVWIDAPSPLSGAGTSLLKAGGERPRYNYHGALSDDQLSSPTAMFKIARLPEDRECRVQDPRAPDQMIVQSIRTERWQAPDRLVVVLDGSRGMEPARNELIRAFRLLPDRTEVAILVARGDEVERLVRLKRMTAEQINDLSAELDRVVFEGGQDNASALVEAWDLASESPDGAVLWIHGPCPILFSSPAPLAHRLSRSPQSPRCYHHQVVVGPNALLDSFSAYGGSIFFQSCNEEAGGLERLIGLWRQGDIHHLSVRSTSPVSVIPSMPEPAPSIRRRLADLWARDTVLSLARRSGAEQRARAIELGSKYQVVTPVTGAVVLQNSAQYERFGLKWPDAPTGFGGGTGVGSMELWNNMGLIPKLAVLAPFFMLFLLLFLFRLRRAGPPGAV